VSSVAYIDSALIKLVVREPETPELEADLTERDGLVMSRLGVVECRRAVARTSKRRLRQRLDEGLEAVCLVEITPAILERASEIRPVLMRSLDAIHLATAISIAEPNLDVIAYDERMADAARVNGLRVAQPGR
jgi:predicted nucleic acid-binding protein